MGADAITLFKNNKHTVTCTVTGLDDLTDYTSKLIVKKHKIDKTNIIEKTGTIADLVITFDFSATETNVESNKYIYYIIIEKTVLEVFTKYTITKDTFEIEYSP